jgi:hydroxyacylglutathione hydrolase
MRPGHIPGSLSVELRPVFATWLGWLVDASRPVVFVLGDDQDRHDLVRQCLTVGVEQFAGEVAGGLPTWRDAGLPVTTVDLIAADALEDRAILDVRQRNEFLAGRVPGARNIELGNLPEADEVPPGPLAVMCGHGERAMTGASLLERAGHHDVAVVRGGPEDWAASTGHTLAAGP